ncbi:unnamed protein product, partial [Acanthoscelides obtectus]
VRIISRHRQILFNTCTTLRSCNKVCYFFYHTTCAFFIWRCEQDRYTPSWKTSGSLYEPSQPSVKSSRFIGKHMLRRIKPQRKNPLQSSTSPMPTNSSATDESSAQSTSGNQTAARKFKINQR